MEKPTIKERVSIFASNLFQEVECISETCFIDGKPDVFTGIITAIDTGKRRMKVLTHDAFIEHFYDVKNLKLIKKPISKISVSDAIDCWREYTLNQLENTDNVALENGLKLIEELFHTKESKYTHYTVRIIPVLDLLRERGYAIQYKNYTVDYLVEIGIFKLV